MKGVRGGIQGHPVRFILATLAVVLGVGLISGALFIRSSVTTSVSDTINALTSADVYVVPPGTSISDVVLKRDAERGYLDPALILQTQSIDGVQAVMPVYLGPIVLTGKDGTVFAGGVVPAIGIGSDDTQAESGTLQAGGALPTSVKEIALEQNTAARAGLVVGDTTTVIVNGNILPVTVTGIVSYNASLGGSVIVILNRVAARALYSAPGMVPFLAVRAKDGVTPQQLKDALTAGLPKDAKADVVLGDDARRQTISQIDGSQGVLNLALIGLGVAGLLVGGCLVGNTFAVVRRTRSREIATLKALGATKGQILAPALKQAAAIGVIGSVVGVAIGFLFAWAFKAYAAKHAVEISLGLPWLWLIVAVALGVALSVVAAWWVVRRAAAISPMDAIRPNRDGQFRMGVPRIVLGAVLMVAGVASTWWGGQGVNNLWYIGGGVLAVVVGAVLFGPVIVVVLSVIFGALMRLFAPLSARLAQRSIRRWPRRAANVAAVFVVFMAAATTLVTLSASASGSGAVGLKQDAPVDFVLTSQAYNRAIPDSVVALVKLVPDTRVTAFGVAPLRAQLTGADAQLDATIMYGPPQTFTSVVQTPVVAGTADAFATGVAVSQAFAKAHGIHVGDSIDFVLAQNTPYEVKASLPVGLIIDSSTFGDMMVPSNWLTRQIPGTTRSWFMPATMVFVSATDESGVAAVQDKLVSTIDPYATVQLQTQDQFVSTANPRVGQARVAMYVVAGVGAVLGLLAMVNALGFGVSRRGRNIAMAKTVGVGDGVIKHVPLMESVLICFSGALAGVVLGIGLAWVGEKALNGMGTITAGVIPWVWLAGLLVLSIVVGLLAAIGPAWRAGRYPALAATA